MFSPRRGTRGGARSGRSTGRPRLITTDGADVRVHDAGAGQASTRRNLDRETIVRAALESIDRDGAQGLTMRKLGQELGVEAMALYRHVTGREDLLEAVVASLLAGMPAELDARLTDSWQGYLQ